ncbi:plastocyanin/azurin family copper-binding protein [Nocardia pseudobrasiliensis]|uniref:Plastocyanin n=1 Tax=Nocardia pseudobrasiliensis TaxID=45979 RepID=A0A370I2P0_9NOCA|nr:plastocyanin/azurin family copper-binding protein [Nocardia pseudobrasiliensis]RDI64431.1 plastocyanin [Nocardia pseudobrasiliensis]
MVGGKLGRGAIAAAAVVAMAGCGSATTTSKPATTTAAAETSSAVSPTAASPATLTVEVDNMKFSPAALTARVGDTVTWKFTDRFPHAVQGIGDAAMGINSPIVNHGEWSYTFTVAGTYRYLCPLHPEMRGTITVQ